MQMPVAALLPLPARCAPARFLTPSPTTMTLRSTARCPTRGLYCSPPHCPCLSPTAGATGRTQVRMHGGAGGVTGGGGWWGAAYTLTPAGRLLEDRPPAPERVIYIAACAPPPPPPSPRSRLSTPLSSHSSPLGLDLGPPSTPLPPPHPAATGATTTFTITNIGYYIDPASFGTSAFALTLSCPLSNYPSSGLQCGCPGIADVLVLTS